MLENITTCLCRINTYSKYRSMGTDLDAYGLKEALIDTPYPLHLPD
jgi:hypothetical protein